MSPTYATWFLERTSWTHCPKHAYEHLGIPFTPFYEALYPVCGYFLLALAVYVYFEGGKNGEYSGSSD